ncbi:MAG TPA: HepT-like ribonuclease domain-containing protein [Chloroflexota bacterium]|jgi:uncharacterized protein with HEPN domain|nr:HepT-like ribonuclease domain-containing protein [Chloroflexota bacterium]
MRAYTAEAIRPAQGRSRTDLENDRLFELATIRLCEMIGEAANKVAAETRHVYPQVPWSQLVGLRNRLILGYASIDFDIMWQVLSRDLPQYVKIEAILSAYR